MVTREVLLYGESLLLPLVAASLEDSPDLRVTQATTWSEASEVLTECVPDVLIYELTDTCQGHVLPLLFENPQLVLIGLDTELNQAMLISGQQAEALTLDGIRTIAERGVVVEDDRLASESGPDSNPYPRLGRKQ